MKVFQSLKFAKVMLSQVFVCPRVGGGGGVEVFVQGAFLSLVPCILQGVWSLSGLRAGGAHLAGMRSCTIFSKLYCFSSLQVSLQSTLTIYWDLSRRVPATQPPLSLRLKERRSVRRLHMPERHLLGGRYCA